MLSRDIVWDSWWYVLLVLVILICVLPSVIRIKTEAVAPRILIHKIDHLFYGELAGVHQTSIKFHSANQCCVIFETTAARNTFVHFRRENGFDVKESDRRLPLLSPNY
jgi:hypothetical protein